MTNLCALLALLNLLSPARAALPLCNTTIWSGACTWPSTPPADCPFPQSAALTGVSFSGRFGAYLTTHADTWYPSWDARSGGLFTCFADGEVCTSVPPPPLPPSFVALQWWWSKSLEDNVLTTDAFPPEDPSGALYEYVGVAAFAPAGAAAAGGCALSLYRASALSREYWTTCGDAEAQAAAAAGYALVGALGAYLPGAPGDNSTLLPPSSPTSLPAAWAAQGAPRWLGAAQYFSAARGDHFLTPEPSAPEGYVRAAPTGGGFFRLQLWGGSAPKCVSASGIAEAQGAAVLVGDDPFNLTVAAVAPVAHPSLAPLNASFPGLKGIYPSTSFVFNGSWLIGLYLLADSSGKGCGNWCHLGPLLAFAVGSTAPAPGQVWSYAGAPFWGGAGLPYGVFEEIDVTQPIRMGVPRFVDMGRDLEHSPDGRAYMTGKGCAANDGVHCSFMTGDSLYLARTRAPLASLGGNLSALNAAASWEFYADSDGSWAPTLAGSKPLLVWPTGMGGATMTYNPALRKFLVVVNIPADRVHPTDCRFTTFVLESSSVTGPFALVSYMEALGPQMYFQQLSSKFWSADGKTGVLFSSGNWDGSCMTQGSNPPGERYGLVTTELTFETN